MKWNPVSETDAPPRNGLHVLVWDGSLMGVAYYSDAIGIWFAVGEPGDAIEHNPTHWMALPPIPQ